jgi:4-amino-4-deoxy-L-arabinose transferase-like glycosyltransferase
LRPDRGDLWRLIAAATIARLLLGWALPLGIDESYMVVAGRGGLQLGYFDHPAISWWMCRIAADLFGSEAAIAVRLPFILLFVLSSWLMACLGREIGGERAGFWAAASFTLSPVFGITSASWVLPDGPLDCALLAAALCLIRGLRGGAWRWWIGAGACFGLAMLSKYTAGLTGIGLVLYLLATPAARKWFARPHPYVAGAVALAAFSPTLVWNAGNGFASLAFQSGRAAAASLHPFGPIVVLAGEALFVLPWIWAGLMLALWRAFRATDETGRLLGWLALPPIVLFCVVALWSRQVLFHWAAPGYLMLFPLLGVWLADKQWAGRAGRATVVLLGAVVVAAVLIIRLPVELPRDPLLQARTWTALRPAVAGSDLPVAALSWADAGKVGIGVGPSHPVAVLNGDARQFLFRPKPAPGSDVLIVAPNRGLAEMRARYGAMFDSITERGQVTISATEFGIFVGHGVKNWPN